MKKIILLSLFMLFFACMSLSFAGVPAGAVVATNGVEQSDNITIMFATGGTSDQVLIGDYDYGNSVCTVYVYHSFTDPPVFASAKLLMREDLVTETYEPWAIKLYAADHNFEFGIPNPDLAPFVFVKFSFAEDTPTNVITAIELKNN